MIDRLWRWLTDVEPDPKQTPKEGFGNVAADPSIGLAVLAEPKRRRLCQKIRNYMVGYDLEDKIDLVERLLLRYALYVMDLQASEKHHHAVPYGLLDHSL